MNNRTVAGQAHDLPFAPRPLPCDDQLFIGIVQLASMTRSNLKIERESMVECLSNRRSRAFPTHAAANRSKPPVFWLTLRHRSLFI